MPVAVSNTYSNSGNTDTLAVNGVAINANELCVVIVATDNTDTTTQINVGSTTDALTLLGRVTHDGPGAGSAEIWYADGLEVTASVNFSVVLSGTGQQGAGVATFTGAGTAPDNFVSAEGSATGGNVLAPTGDDADNMFVDVFAAQGFTQLGANQTAILDTTPGGTSRKGTYQDGADGDEMTATWFTAMSWAHAAARIPEPSGSETTVTPTVGVANFVGETPDLAITREALALVGELALEGLTPGLQITRTLEPIPDGTHFLATGLPTVSTELATTVTPIVGEAAFEGLTPTISELVRALFPALGEQHWYEGGVAAIIDVGVEYTPAPIVGEAAFEGQTPTVTVSGASELPSVGEATLEGLIPGVEKIITADGPDTGEAAFDSPGAGGASVAITRTFFPTTNDIHWYEGGVAAFIDVSVERTARPQTGVATFEGQTPQVVRGGTLEVVAQVGNVTYLGLAPTVAGPVVEVDYGAGGGGKKSSKWDEIEAQMRHEDELILEAIERFVRSA